MKALFISVILILTAPAGAVSVGAADTSGARVEPQMKLANPEQALARALEYTGFDKAEGYSKASVTEVKLVVGHEKKTPLISRLMDGKQVWSVRFENIVVRSGRRTTKRDFTVTLDPITGKLFQIISVADNVGSSDTLPEPIAADLEERDKRIGVLYNGLPEQLPGVNFDKVLDIISFANPARSKVVKGLYVDCFEGDTRRPQLWIVIIRGSESPIMPSGRAVNRVLPAQRNSMWCFVDGEAGKWSYYINAPLDEKALDSAWEARQKK